METRTFWRVLTTKSRLRRSVFVFCVEGPRPSKAVSERQLTERLKTLRPASHHQYATPSIPTYSLMHPDTIPVLMVAILTHLPRLFGWWMERRSDCNRLYNTRSLSRVRCIVYNAIQRYTTYTLYSYTTLYTIQPIHLPSGFFVVWRLILDHHELLRVRALNSGAVLPCQVAISALPV